jgi:hypothetical protein
MNRTIVHQQIYRAGPFGSTLNTTLCGRMQLRSDGMNTGHVVTCKLCIKKRRALSDTTSESPNEQSPTHQEDTMNRELSALLELLQVKLERYAESGDPQDQAKAKRIYNEFVSLIQAQTFTQTR